MQLERGDAQSALQHCDQALTIHQTLEAPLEACKAAAITARCDVHLGRPAETLAGLNATLQRLQHESAGCPDHETIDLRWNCQQVLDALGDQRAGPLLEQLHADVQATAAARTEAADRDRLIQAIPTFRDIVAAWSAAAATRSA